MPLHGDHLVLVLQRLHHGNLLQVHRVTDVHLRIVARTGDKVAVDRVGYPAHFLRMELLVREALLHVEVPDRDRAVTVTDSREAIQRVSHDVALG